MAQEAERYSVEAFFRTDVEFHVSLPSLALCFYKAYAHCNAARYASQDPR